MNSFNAFRTAINDKNECIVIIEKSCISNMHKFAKKLSKKYKCKIYDFSKNVFILKNNCNLIIFSYIYENNLINFNISFILNDDDAVLTDNYLSDKDYETDKVC